VNTNGPIELHYSNNQTAARLQLAFASALEYVMKEQQEDPDQRVTTADILAALRGSIMSFAKHTIVDKADYEGNVMGALVNKAAITKTLADMQIEIDSWAIPALPPDADTVSEPPTAPVAQEEQSDRGTDR